MQSICNSHQSACDFECQRHEEAPACVLLIHTTVCSIRCAKLIKCLRIRWNGRNTFNLWSVYKNPRHFSAISNSRPKNGIHRPLGKILHLISAKWVWAATSSFNATRRGDFCKTIDKQKENCYAWGSFYRTQSGRVVHTAPLPLPFTRAKTSAHWLHSKKKLCEWCLKKYDGNPTPIRQDFVYSVSIIDIMDRRKSTWILAVRTAAEVFSKCMGRLEFQETSYVILTSTTSDRPLTMIANKTSFQKFWITVYVIVTRFNFKSLSILIIVRIHSFCAHFVSTTSELSFGVL